MYNKTNRFFRKIIMSSVTLKEIHSPPNPNGAIILVHGWIGGYSTFELMPAFLTSDFFQYQIYVTIIDTTLPDTTTENISNELRNLIINQDISQKIIFIAHSYGGNIVKKVLMNDNFTKEVDCVIFIACPHKNFTLSKRVKALDWLRRKTQKIGWKMIKTILHNEESEYFILDEIQEQSTKIQTDYKESDFFKHSYNIFSPSDQVILSKYANIEEFPQDRRYEANGRTHTDICKPNSKQDNVYQLIIGIIKSRRILECNMQFELLPYYRNYNHLFYSEKRGTRARNLLLKTILKGNASPNIKKISLEIIGDIISNAENVEIHYCQNIFFNARIPKIRQKIEEEFMKSFERLEKYNNNIAKIKFINVHLSNDDEIRKEKFYQHFIKAQDDPRPNNLMSTNHIQIELNKKCPLCDFKINPKKTKLHFICLKVLDHQLPNDTANIGYLLKVYTSYIAETKPKEDHITCEIQQLDNKYIEINAIKYPI